MLQEKLNKWEEQSKEMIGSFLHMFGTPSIEQIWNSSKDRIARAISPSPSPPHSRGASPGPNQETEEEPREKLKRLN